MIACRAVTRAFSRQNPIQFPKMKQTSVESRCFLSSTTKNKTNKTKPRQQNKFQALTARHPTFTSKNSYSNSAGSSTNDYGAEFRPVYVHPLSQVVLEYLQEYRHDWIVSKGLDRSLTLRRDGSFEAKYIPSTSQTRMNAGSTSVSNVYGATIPIHGPNDTNGSFGAENDHFQNIRIWTSYDDKEKKHWLTVRKGVFRQRFMLQDNMLSAWQSNRGPSTPERIQIAVEEMIKAVDRLDASASTISRQLQWEQRGQRRFRKQ